MEFSLVCIAAFYTLSILQPTLVLVVWNSGLIVRILKFILFICLLSFTASFQDNIGKYIYVLSIELCAFSLIIHYLSIHRLFIDVIIYYLLIHTITAFLFIIISLLYLFLDLSIHCGMTLWAMACHETIFTYLLDIILAEIISEPILRLASQALRIYYLSYGLWDNS